MKIGVLGAGNIGGTLGAKWAGKQHQVFFGVREPGRDTFLEKVGRMQGEIQVGHSAQAIAFADVVVFAVPGAAVGPIVEENKEQLAGKTIIDASNNMRGESRHALDLLRSAVPTASLYRAFSSLGWENLAEPEFDGVKADLFYCGDAEARSTVDQLVADVGLNPVYVGDAGQVALVEGMTDMWFNLALRQQLGRRIAFKLLK